MEGIKRSPSERRLSGRMYRWLRQRRRGAVYGRSPSATGSVRQKCHPSGNRVDHRLSLVALYRMRFAKPASMRAAS
jgi:hypothetical protein